MNTTETKKLLGPDKVMDVRPIPCSVKHGLIIKQWLELPVGGHFILLNDHDPVPLYYQFAAQWPNAFTWQHLVKGPEEFRVKITKLKATAAAGAALALAAVAGFFLRRPLKRLVAGGPAARQPPALVCATILALLGGSGLLLAVRLGAAGGGWPL